MKSIIIHVLCVLENKAYFVIIRGRTSYGIHYACVSFKVCDSPYFVCFALSLAKRDVPISLTKLVNFSL